VGEAIVVSFIGSYEAAPNARFLARIHRRKADVEASLRKKENAAVYMHRTGS
jgi:hypothetical protein